MTGNDYEDQDAGPTRSGDYLNGMLDAALLMSMSLERNKDHEMNDVVQGLIGAVLDMKTWQLMDTMGTLVSHRSV